MARCRRGYILHGRYAPVTPASSPMTRRAVVCERRFASHVPVGHFAWTRSCSLSLRQHPLDGASAVASGLRLSFRILVEKSHPLWYYVNICIKREWPALRTETARTARRRRATCIYAFPPRPRRSRRMSLTHVNPPSFDPATPANHREIQAEPRRPPAKTPRVLALKILRAAKFPAHNYKHHSRHRNGRSLGLGAGLGLRLRTIQS